MKKYLSLTLVTVLCLAFFAGCGTTVEADENTVYVNDKGKVTSIDVEELDQSYYDAEELETYIDDAVEAYTSENGKGTVKVKSLSVDGTTAKLTMTYKSVTDYTNFNGIELYQGSVVEALAAGYSFNVDFVKVEDGVATATAEKQDIYAEQGLKAVIIRANTDVIVDGEICYVSAEHVKLTGTDSVSIRSGYTLEPETGTESVSATEESIAAEIQTGTEEVGATEEATEEAAADGVIDETEADGQTEQETSSNESFETEVYTYILYR